MRLGQLSRRLGIRTSDIVSFLATQNVSIDPDPNGKIDDRYVPDIMRQFGFHDQQTTEIARDGDVNPSNESSDTRNEPLVSGTTREVDTSETETEVHHDLNDDDIQSPVEVIKAPKIPLPGLTVLGRIELQEPKKKEEEELDTNSPEIKGSLTSRENRNRRDKGNWQDERVPRHETNPVARKREKLAREAERQRKQEEEREKERRMNHYIKKVKPSVPTKPARIHDEQTEELVSTYDNRPQSTWAKFVRWLRRE